MIKFDLHMHSTFSDGSLTPRELVNLVKKENLDCFIFKGKHYEKHN